MSLSIKKGIEFLKNFDPFDQPTLEVKNWLEHHPATFKAAIIINHLFRAVMMAGFMLALPYSAPINALICAAGTLFYRLTIQGNCAYKLDLTSFLGGSALLLAKDHLPVLVNAVGNSTLMSHPWSVLSFVPLAFYAFYVFITSDAVTSTKFCCKH